MNNQLKVLEGDNRVTLKAVVNESVHLVVTSPPYFNAKNYSHYENITHYMDIMSESFTEVHRLLKPSRMCCVNVSCVIVERESRNKQSYRIPIPFYFVPMMEKIGFEFLEDIIWVKPEGSAKNRNGGFHQHRKPVAYKPNVITEYILVFKKKANFLIDKILKTDSPVYDDYERTNVWSINPETSIDEHPAAFPEAIPDRLISYYSYQTETVLDPFAGSGTTGYVALKKNRKAILCEKVPDYIKLIHKRCDDTLPSLLTLLE